MNHLATRRENRMNGSSLESLMFQGDIPASADADTTSDVNVTNDTAGENDFSRPLNGPRWNSYY